MYAVIKTGAKQHKVSEGDILSVEKLDGNKGDEVVFSDVLMVSDDKEIKVGKPFVDGAKVVGEIIAQKKGPKLTVYHMKRRKGFHKKTGHRQNLTSMKIKKISI
ncbi:MAG TPA: 50S ribosomal protein L21 [Smithella sp.]|jgi:large subunit ribosomal protein L21|nr:50S ribosomal protein L21 [Smithella sp.]NMC96349.1 50S ribosomal protein L21 [Deltaproteobacteria bacterium]OQC51627.1 MAG: 50S ribosomal protein L21 [Deltaproteobacteria bacterium ADurb.Bin022]HNQ64904.1 50S ribosomal protein L21 [Smithella sp.]HOG09674.1 50S ribosomal protein L21 [Smithella sp.]